MSESDNSTNDRLPARQEDVEDDADSLSTDESSEMDNETGGDNTTDALPSEPTSGEIEGEADSGENVSETANSPSERGSSMSDSRQSQSTTESPESPTDGQVETTHLNPSIESMIETLRGNSKVIAKKEIGDKGLAEVAVVFDSQDGYRYVVHEPELTEAEDEFKKDLFEKVEDTLKYTNVEEKVSVDDGEDRIHQKREFYRQEARRILEEWGEAPLTARIKHKLRLMSDEDYDDIALSDDQIKKFAYYVQRKYAGYGKIDVMMRDSELEEISCNGAEIPIHVNHDEYGNQSMKANVEYEPTELDDYVQSLSQRSGKHTSVADPLTDAALPDGSRAQITFTDEVSDTGSHFTIRLFDEVPLTPTQLIRYGTFDLTMMAYLMLCVENEQSLMVVGGTASGKTTTLKALGLFIPPSAKIVSIEDTRELVLPTQHWIKSVTRDAFGGSDKGKIDEYDLIEASLRQRPEYILMGEVRGSEASDLFQAMNSGHTTWSTLHADETDSAIQRLGNDPMNVSRQLMKTLDIVIVQEQTKVEGDKERRVLELSEITGYSKRDAEITHQKLFTRDPSEDTYLRENIESEALEDVRRKNGWSEDRLEQELAERKELLTYLVENDILHYEQVYPIIYNYVQAKNLDRESDNIVLKRMRDGTLDGNSLTVGGDAV